MWSKVLGGPKATKTEGQDGDESLNSNPFVVMASADTEDDYSPVVLLENPRTVLASSSPGAGKHARKRRKKKKVNCGRKRARSGNGATKKLSSSVVGSKKAAAVARSTLSPARLSSTSVPTTFTTPWAKIGLTLAVLNLCTTPVAAQNITTYNTTLPFVAKAIESTCDLTDSELAYLYEVMIKAWSNPFSLLAIAVAYVVIKKASPIAKKYVLLAKALIADKIGQVKGMFYSMLFSR